MLGPEPGNGIALLCDADGVILRCLHNELAVEVDDLPGRLFTELVDAGSAEKALRFIEAVQQRRAAFDWEMNLPLAGRLASLHFAGTLLDEGLLIVGATARNGLAVLFEGMTRINNEQANALRAALKEISVMESSDRQDSWLFDELTYLNNELVTLQRERVRTSSCSG